jgi:hypothetical protein
MRAVESGQLSFDALDDEQLATLSDAVRFERRRRARPGPPRMPKRVVAVDAMELLRLPATPRLVSWVVTARTGERLESKLLTTIRRDDRNAWNRDVGAGRTPGPKIAPALHHEMLEPLRALLTLTTWPLADRIVTPHSPRADHPTAILRLLDEADRLEGLDGEGSARLTALAARLAIGLPGGGGVVGQGTNASRDELRRIAEAERGRFVKMATRERNEGAERAAQLTEEFRIWGSPGIRAVEAPRRARRV